MQSKIDIYRNFKAQLQGNDIEKIMPFKILNNVKFAEYLSAARYNYLDKVQQLL